jgi:dTDP-4-dehydrorhamnose reductase
MSVVVLGGSGLVGSRVLELWAADMPTLAPTHAQLDVLDAEALTAFLRQTDAPVVLNVAAWADVDGAEPERGNQHGRVYALNAAFPARLASLCGELGKHLVQVSTDYVFDGTNAQRPYREDDPTHALCWYAETKLLGERSVLESGASACVARIEMPFSGGQHPKRDFARTIAERLEAGQPFRGIVDQHITPIFLDDAARALRLLVETRFTGVVHVASANWTTPFGFAQSIAMRLDLNADLVQPEEYANFSKTRPARRPQHSWLDVSAFVQLFGPHVLRPVEAELDDWQAQRMLERVTQ